jgi:hypothetical protein
VSPIEICILRFVNIAFSYRRKATKRVFQSEPGLQFYYTRHGEICGEVQEQVHLVGLGFVSWVLQGDCGFSVRLCWWKFDLDFLFRYR